jgi:hypothetical protein
VSRLALLHPAVVAMGLGVAAVRLRRAVAGQRRYEGSAEDILRAGLEACWNGEYLTASPGTYRHFWTRDLGFAAPALVRLGDPWPDRLRSSLEWALDAWQRRGSHVTTTIAPFLRWPVDVFDYGVDSLPLLVASLRALGAEGGALAREHADWLAGEIRHYVEHVIAPETGLVRSDRAFSAHRDTFRNGSTAYANTMVAVLARDVAETGWGPDLLSRHFLDDAGKTDWSLPLRRHFWLGDRFRDRLGTDATSGEANVWPFYSGLVDDRSMQASALQTLRREGFATPYPLKFEVDHRTDGQLWAFRVWSADYQTTTSWSSLGSIYVSLLRELDPAAAEAELGRMRELIERDGTFWEVLDSRGRPWQSASRLSISDQSMLWGAILLETSKSAAQGGAPLRIA